MTAPVRTARSRVPGGDELEGLRQRVAELEETLGVIRQGGVDAVVVGRKGEPGSERVYTLTSAERPYRAIVDEMDEGALTVSPRGIVLYANAWLGSVLGRPPADLVGRPLGSILTGTAVAALTGLPAGSRKRADAILVAGTRTVPVMISAVGIDVEGLTVTCLVVTDMTVERAARSALEIEVERRTGQVSALGRALAVANAADRALVRAQHAGQLMSEVCRIAVKAGGYALAWVGEAVEDGGAKVVRPVASSGAVSFLDDVTVLWDDSPEGSGPTGRAIKLGFPTYVNDTLSAGDFRPWRKAAAERGFRSLCSFPIDAAGWFCGAMTIYAREPDAFGARELDVLRALTGDLSFGLSRLRDVERLRENLDVTVDALSAAAELRDPYTAGHMRRVAQLATAIAERMGLPEDDCNGIETAAKLHDVGKLMVPGEILAKPTALLPEEMGLIRLHSAAGADIVSGIRFPWPVADMILQHHERMDGTGYPGGLAGDEILLGARVLAVADVVEAMSAHRPYRPALGLPAALRAVRHVGFDPDVAAACVEVCRAPGFRYHPRGHDAFAAFGEPRRPTSSPSPERAEVSPDAGGAEPRPEPLRLVVEHEG